MSTPKGSGLSEGGANKRQKFKDLLLSLESIQKSKKLKADPLIGLVAAVSVGM